MRPLYNTVEENQESNIKSKILGTLATGKLVKNPAWQYDIAKWKQRINELIQNTEKYQAFPFLPCVIQ